MKVEQLLKTYIKNELLNFASPMFSELTWSRLKDKINGKRFPKDARKRHMENIVLSDQFRKWKIEQLRERKRRIAQGYLRLAKDIGWL